MNTTKHCNAENRPPFTIVLNVSYLSSFDNRFTQKLELYMEIWDWNNYPSRSSAIQLIQRMLKEHFIADKRVPIKYEDKNNKANVGCSVNFVSVFW